MSAPGRAHSRVILVAQPYTPVEGSHSERVLHLARYLSARGHSLKVITIRVGARYPQRGVEETVHGVEVIRTFPGIVHSTTHGGTHTPLPTKRSADTSIQRRSSHQALASHVVHRLTELYRSFAIPDSYVDWIPTATSALLKHLTSDSVVISTSMPVSAHVATLIARGLRTFRWIADFGDPWFLDNSRPKRSWKWHVHKVLEQRVAQHADALVFTTERTVSDYRAYYGNPIDAKIHLARMGFDGTAQLSREHELRRPTLFYGGSVPPENRSIGPLLQAANRLQDWDFVFSGQSVQCVMDAVLATRQTTPSNVRLIDWLDRDAYRSFSTNATACLVLGNRNPQQVPGKVYQLLGVGARILYVGGLPKAEDEAWRICERCGHWASNEPDSIIKALRSLRTEHETAGHGCSSANSEYEWARQMALFGTLVNELGGRYRTLRQ